MAEKAPFTKYDLIVVGMILAAVVLMVLGVTAMVTR